MLTPGPVATFTPPNKPDISLPCRELLMTSIVILVLVTAESLHFPEGEYEVTDTARLSAVISSGWMECFWGEM